MASATRVPNSHTTWVRPMGPTGCLAPRIDRSYHLLLLQLRRDRSDPTCRSADLSGGLRRCSKHPRAVVILPCHHQLPGDAGDLVGERHGRELRRPALAQGHQPRAWMTTTLPSIPDPLAL